MEETFEFAPDAIKGYGGYRNLDSLKDWVRQARMVDKPSRNSPQSMLNTLELIDAIYQSSEEGRRIECCIGS